MVHHGLFAEATWRPAEMPLAYRSAPVLVDDRGGSDVPALIGMIGQGPPQHARRPLRQQVPVPSQPPSRRLGSPCGPGVLRVPPTRRVRRRPLRGFDAVPAAPHRPGPWTDIRHAALRVLPVTRAAEPPQWSAGSATRPARALAEPASPQAREAVMSPCCPMGLHKAPGSSSGHSTVARSSTVKQHVDAPPGSRNGVVSPMTRTRSSCPTSYHSPLIGNRIVTQRPQWALKMCTRLVLTVSELTMSPPSVPRVREPRFRQLRPALAPPCRSLREEGAQIRAPKHTPSRVASPCCDTRAGVQTRNTPCADACQRPSSGFRTPARDASPCARWISQFE